MELTKIEIENYKSITEPITIAFYNGLHCHAIKKEGVKNGYSIVIDGKKGS